MSENNRSFSSSITLTRVADGTSADSIIVELPYEEVLRFVTVDNNNDEIVQFSPEDFVFRVFNVQGNQYITDFNWGLYYLNGNQEYSVIATKESQGKFNSAFSSFTLQNGKIEAVKLNLNNFYEVLSEDSNFTYLKEEIDNGRAFFKFVYIDSSNEPAALGFFAIRNGMSNEMAKMVIGANSISMAVRESTLEFSADGLALVNGDFTIYKTEIKEGDEIFYADDQGNLVMKGTIYANAGQFHGDVYAENGSFNGSIKATDGDIGGFQIVANSYSPANKSSNAEDNAGLYYLLDEGLGVYRYISVKDNELYISVVYDSNKNYYQKFNGSVFDKNITYYELNSSSSGYVITNDKTYVNSKTYYTVRELEYLDSLGGQKVETHQNGTIYYVKLNLSSADILYEGNGAQLSSANNSIILNGTEGKIIAENIELGSGAKVTGKIEFANSGSNTASAVLYNPDTQTDKLFLHTEKIKLYSNGKLTLGNIELYGGDSDQFNGYIRSYIIDSNNQTQNGEWCIKEDGTAYFDNIYVNDAHIQNSILEINTIQSVGSTMIFKDSWTITSLTSSNNRYVATLDGLANLLEDDYVMTNNEKFLKVEEVSQNKDKTNSIVTLQAIGNGTVSNGEILTKFGKVFVEYLQKTEDQPQPGRTYYILQDGEYIVAEVDTSFDSNTTYYYKTSDSPDCVISIRGESSLKGGSTFSSGNALVISSFIDNNGTITYNKHLILGDLSDSNIDDLSEVNGYGLYADNVYLNGSLITRDITKGYCGINTLSNASFVQNTALDDSPIIFWGGAESKTSEAIQQAPFQVTSKGTMYCKNAIIEQSIFTGEIHTAEIYGSNDDSPALSIMDTNKGISFKSTVIEYDENGAESEVQRETFSIGQNGLHVNNQYFINFNEAEPIFSGTLNASTSNKSTVYNGTGIHFGSNGFLKQDINVGNYSDENLTEGIPQILIGFEESKETGAGESTTTETTITRVADFEKFQIRNYVKTFLDKELYLGRKENGAYFMEHRPVINSSGISGYDIYIF